VGEFAPAHIIILVVVILLVFGSRKLPEIARGIGTGMREFKDSLQGREAEEPRQPPAPPAGVAATADRPEPAGSPVEGEHSDAQGEAISGPAPRT
jgi:sec-independent protein translocase protein TatA